MVFLVCMFYKAKCSYNISQIDFFYLLIDNIDNINHACAGFLNNRAVARVRRPRQAGRLKKPGLV